MSLDPHINAEVRIENEAIKLEMVIDSGEPKTTVKSWVWISAFDLFGPTTSGTDFPVVYIVKLIFEDIDLVASLVLPDTITINKLLNEVELSNWTARTNTYIVTIEADESSWTVVVTAPIS